MTSAGDATGPYSFTVSAVDGNSTYTGSATASLIVASKLDVAAAATLSSGKGASSIDMKAAVAIGKLAVPNAAVTFTLRRGAEVVTTMTVTSDASGAAVASYRLNKKRDLPGTYQLTVTANMSGIPGTATATVAVP